MPITAPPSVTALPTPPDPGDRTTFNARAYPWSVALTPWTAEVRAVASNVYGNALATSDAATTAAAQAVVAQAAASVSAGAANFKGEWSTLRGALARPACVKHSGRFWLLLSDLTDVTSATPGVHAAWAVMDVGTVPTQLVTASGTVAAVVGVRYLIAANSVTLTAPTTTTKGDYHGACVMSGVTGFVWAFGATKLRSSTPGNMTWDLGAKALDLFFEDATRGYV